MSEPEQDTTTQPGEQGESDPSQQHDQETIQAGAAGEEEVPEKEEDPGSAEGEQAKQEEESGLSQDPVAAEASPGTGVEDASEKESEESGMAEGEQANQEEESGLSQDPAAAEASPGTAAEEVPKKEEESGTVEGAQTEQKESPEPSQGQEAAQASPGTGTEEAPKKEEESGTAEGEQTEQKELPEPSQGQEAAQASPGTGMEEAPKKELDSSTAEGEQAKQTESSGQNQEPAAAQTSPGTDAGEASEKDKKVGEGGEKPEEKNENAAASATTPSVSDTPQGPAPVADDASPEQKVAIVTGANNGIGLVAAEKLARDGYDVIMACRNEEKATKAVQEVEKKVPGAKVSFMKLDLNSLRSVREFADAFRSLGKPLHVLCNNAGLTTGFSLKQRLETEDGFEMTIGVNHFGHFLLTHLLLEELKTTASRCGEARIVHTSSMLHDPETSSGKRGAPAHLDFDNLMLDKEGTFDGVLAYKNSKLANCVFSVELAKRLEGSNITTNTLCPGFIPSTGFTQNESLGMKIRLALLVPFLKLFGVTRTVEQGGALIHDLATNDKWKGLTGRHFVDFKEMDSSKESRDPEVGKRLWDISADLVKYEQAKAV